jgi:pyruvate/2-oxoglutarate dehydrogenase complex dihydrolipoamide dehydrogenase (E3) component
MTQHEVDVVVIGMGVGGEEVAGRLVRSGLAVVGVERELVGGECPNWGCVPSKMMIRAANLLAEARRIDGMAGTSSIRPDWGVVARRIRDEATDDWDDRVAIERFEASGGAFRRGHAHLDGPGCVVVDGTRLRARRGIVLATGSRPAIPPIPGLSAVEYWTNRDAIAATAVPPSLIVVGGGAIGLELGQVFARFGSTVSVVEVAERLLPPEEPEAGELLASVFREEGIEVRTSARVASVSSAARATIVHFDDGTRIEADRLLVATGRRASIDGLGLESVGLDADARWIPVDENLRAADGVWAVGDVTGVGAFTHVAVYQGRIAAADILGDSHEPANYTAMPRVTFTDPEVGSVGTSEATARARGLDVRVGRADVAASARGWIHKAGNEGFIKLVEDARRGVLVGATAAGPNGGEVLSMLTLAVHEATPVSRLRDMIYAYPTFHRGVEDALEDLARNREPGMS